MEKDYTIVNGELYHYGVPGMKWGRKRGASIVSTQKPKRIPGVVVKDESQPKGRRIPGVIAKSEKVEIMPERKKYEVSTTSKTNSGDFKKEPPIDVVDEPKANSTKSKAGPGETKPKQAGTAKDDSSKNTQQSNKQNNNNNNSNKQTNKPDSNNVLQDEINNLNKESKAAKNIGKELQEMGRTTDNIPVNRPRMDLSHMTNKELQDQIDRELKELQYNRLFSQPTKKERAKAKVSKFFNTTGTVLAYTGSALAIAAAIKELKK